MSDLYFWTATSSVTKVINGFIEYEINKKANLIQEGKNIENMIIKIIINKDPYYTENIKITSISKLT